MQNVTSLLQQHYGIWKDGHQIAVDELSCQDTDVVHTAKMLRERLRHIASSLPEGSTNPEKIAVEQLIAEQAFTILNRFCALRMCEERNLILPSISKGYNSDGFLAYDSVAEKMQMPKFNRYVMYIQSVFDELSLELPSVFDRYSPYGLVFPDENTLLQLFDLVNQNDLSAWYDEQNGTTVNFWQEDETLGWMFQDYNSLEERRKMREESSKPRNSREMAVRNQFFTPEYIVRFLTDNSLGRIWYEMTNGESEIANKVCNYMVIRPNETYAPRQIKEPTEIRTMDPTCGSMHFGLYVYEVYEFIYMDAWDNHPNLLQEYRELNTRDSFRKLIPSLILEHNIYGCEIDPRALQIAALSLWLRAQRSYSELNLLPSERPLIKRTNLVLAESMPGNKKLLKSLLEELDAPMKRLINKVWDKMKFVGEAGLLFKMEKEIEDDIENLRKNWSKINVQKGADLFDSEEEKQRKEALDKAAIRLAKSEIKEKFFSQVTENLQIALQNLSTQLSEEEGYENTLFTEDATRGFAFIELCQKRFDCIVMNPPFGEGSENTIEYLDSNYPEWCRNLVCAFFDRMQEMLTDRGKLGAIFDRTVLIKSSYESFRLKNICGYIYNCADTGWNVLDANVETSTLIVNKVCSNNHALFIDILDVKAEDKDRELKSHIESYNNGNLISSNYYVVSKDFENLPNSIVGYTFDESLLDLFKMDNLEKRGLVSKKGHDLTANIYPRNFYEITDSRNFRHMYNGGPFHMFYFPYSDVVMWKEDAIRQDSLCNLRSLHLQQKGTIGYGKRGDILDAHILKKDFIFTREGIGMPCLSPNEGYASLSYLNSIVAQYTINLYCEQHKGNGYVNILPMPDYITKINDIKSISDRIIDIKRRWYSLDETIFEYHGIISQLSIQDTISNSINAVQATLNADIETCSDIIEENDNLWIDLANIAKDSDLYELLISYKSRRPSEEFITIDKASKNNIINKSVFAQDIVMELVGIAFGRWDIEYAQRKKIIPPFGDVFDALPFMPVVSLSDKPANYAVNIPEDGILSNATDSDICLAARVRDVMHLIWGAKADDIEYELCTLIGVDSLQTYFEKPTGFFDYHFKRYTKSRRKAPIYWPISSEDGSITYWVYYPSLSHNTIPALILKLREDMEATRNVINAAVLAHDKVRETEGHAKLQQIEGMMNKLTEIKAMGYVPNHDDGVPVTAAPFANLFQHRAWQQECIANMEALEKGDYDWSHLALSLYPARVTDKAKNKWYFAIMHGLESICENKPKEKKPRKKKADQQLHMNFE